MSAAVRDILQQIEQLPEEDRLLLDDKLVELADAQWRYEAEKVRRVARARGLDQSAIDRAIEELRHPA